MNRVHIGESLMRILAAALLPVMFAVVPVHAAEADPCAQTRKAEVEFSVAGQKDIVTVTALPSPVAPGGDTIAPDAGEGPNCVLSTIVLTIHSPNGALVASNATMLVALDYDAGHQMSPVSPDALTAILDRLSQVTVFVSSAAPPSDSPMISMPFGAEDYERMKALNAPALCYNKDTTTQTCIINEVGSVSPFFEVTSM